MLLRSCRELVVCVGGSRRRQPLPEALSRPPCTCYCAGSSLPGEDAFSVLGPRGLTCPHTPCGQGALWVSLELRRIPGRRWELGVQTREGRGGGGEGKGRGGGRGDRGEGRGKRGEEGRRKGRGRGGEEEARAARQRAARVPRARGQTKPLGGEKVTFGGRKHKEEVQATPRKGSQWRVALTPSVRHPASGLVFVDNVTGLQCAIIVRSAFSLRYIMIHAENVIKILW